MKVAAIIQARMASKRYPEKVLETISNHPVLFHVIERIRDSQAIDVIVVATTTDPADKILIKRAREFQVQSFAGSENDLIKRFLSAAEMVGADVIVRVLCDNPLFEPSYIDECLAMLEKQKADYCYVIDAVPGTGVEIFTKEALKKANDGAKEPRYREEITSFFLDNPDKFKIVKVQAHDRFKLPTLNLAFDDKEDLKLIRALYHKFYHEDTIVPLVKVISYLKQHPEVAKLNAEVVKKAVEEREKAEREKAEAEALAAAERLAARQREEAERQAERAKALLVKKELDDIIKEKDIFKLEPDTKEIKKEVKWSDLFGEEKEEEKKDEPSLFAPEEQSGKSAEEEAGSVEQETVESDENAPKEDTDNEKKE